MQLAEAIGGTIADLLLEMSTQILFTVLGVALLAHVAGRSDVSDFATRALWVATAIVGGAFVALWLGLAAPIERAALRMGRSLGWPASAEAGGLHEALVGCFRSLPRVALAAFWHLISWLLGGLEVCLILHFFGTDIGPGSGLIIESLGQALKVGELAVPGAIGVQEGGYVVHVSPAEYSAPRLRSRCLSSNGCERWCWVFPASFFGIGRKPRWPPRLRPRFDG